MDVSEILQGLNERQREAVTHPARAMRVIAGAGSGKTRVLVQRMQWLMAVEGVSPYGLLALTFTNKAAREMRQRLEAALQRPLGQLWMGTFHGICHRILRRHAPLMQWPEQFVIMDSDDQLRLVKRMMRARQWDEAVMKPKNMVWQINAYKEEGLRAEDVPPTPHPGELAIREFYHDYEKLCRQQGTMDFAELLLLTVELFTHHPEVLQNYQQRFQSVLVDEFQDTNALQYRLVQQLCAGGAQLFVVGDDDQSIYGWRGARVENILQLERDFPALATVRLEQNYRSTQTILDAANAVITHNSERLGKNLRTEAESGDKIRYFCAYNDYEEAQFITEECRHLQRHGTPLDQIAILYRSNAQSRIIEQQLFQAAIPYRIYGGFRFYERQEIKHALAYLRLAVNPNDDNALLRVINFPPRGIGTRSVENIQAAAAEQGISLWQAACGMGAKASKIAAFVQLIDSFQQQIPHFRLPEILQTILQDSGLYAHYQAQKQASERERTENLDELINAAEFFRPEDSPFETQPENNTDSPEFPILAFLSNASLESGETQAGAGQEAVQLMTVHAAKGLEFDNVFLSGMEEGRFPSEMSLAEHGGLQEERRLMYVAITRARKRLYISMAQQRQLYGITQASIVSRFIDEIPSELLHHLSPPKAPLGSLKTSPTSFGAAKNHSAHASQRQPENECNATSHTPRDYHGYTLGENIRHAKFGTGVIIDAIDKGSSARLTINFGANGIKELDTAFAKLEKLA